MDSVVSPATAIAIGKLGGLGVLDLEGLWTRYDDPEPLLAEITELGRAAATRRLQEIYAEPIKEELIGRAHRGDLPRPGWSPRPRCRRSAPPGTTRRSVDAGADIFVIRGTTVSAEHVSGRAEPLNLKQFIYELDIPVIVGGCATYTAALHLMRTGAAGRAGRLRRRQRPHHRGRARRRGADGDRDRRRGRGPPRLPGRVRRPLRARDRRRLDDPQRRHRQGARARRGRGDGRLAAGPHAPRRPAAATTGAARPTTPSCRAAPGQVGTIGTLEQILHGPSTVPDGSMNLMGALAHDGHGRLLRAEGVPAGRGGRHPRPRPPRR
jgi:IMP dehydrogenase